ncbi:polymeric immunoglobulin receptor-like, partial [Clarias magur]
MAVKELQVSFLILEMKKSFSTTFILLSASILGVVLNVAVNEKGNEGSAAVVHCPYNATYTHYPKYFCKGPKRECKTLIKTDDLGSWVYKGRLSLNDNTERNKFVVTISNLSLEDEGQYGCGVSVSGPDLFIVVNLTVIKAQKQPSSTLLNSGSILTRTGSSTDSTGSSTQTTMSRSLDLKEQSKKGNNVFLYIGGAFSAVLLLVAVISFVKCRTKSSAGRVSNSIKDIKTEKTWDVKDKFFAMDGGPGAFYSFLIRNLTQEDAGKYRFGVESQNGSQFNVELDVENGRYYGKPGFSQTIDPGDVVTFSCTYPPGDENYMKIVYKVTSQSITPTMFTYADYEEKGRYVLHVSSRDSVINMSISNVTVDDGGLYLCGVLKKDPLYASIFAEMQLKVTATGNIYSPGSLDITTMVSVGVALLLITGFALFAYKLWCRKTQGVLLPADTENPVNSELDHTAEDYEEIKTYNCHAYPNAVYNNVEIPTYPSASPSE